MQRGIFQKLPTIKETEKLNLQDGQESSRNFVIYFVWKNSMLQQQE